MASALPFASPAILASSEAPFLSKPTLPDVAGSCPAICQEDDDKLELFDEEGSLFDGVIALLLLLLKLSFVLMEGEGSTLPTMDKDVGG